MKAGQENHNTWVCRIYCNVNQYFDSDNPGTATKKVGGKALEAVQKLWGYVEEKRREEKRREE